MEYRIAYQKTIGHSISHVGVIPIRSVLIRHRELVLETGAGRDLLYADEEENITLRKILLTGHWLNPGTPSAQLVPN